MNEHGRELQRVVDVVQLERLTVQDRNVLQLVAKGWTNREIGVRLGRTPGTIKNYIAAILSKLNVSDRTQAAVDMDLSQVVRIEPVAGTTTAFAARARGSGCGTHVAERPGGLRQEGAKCLVGLRLAEKVPLTQVAA